MNGRRPRRLHWALLASLVLHALLVAFLVLRPRDDRAQAGRSRPIEIDLVVEAPKPPPPAPVPAQTPPTPPAEPQKQAARKKAATAASAPVAAVSPAQPEETSPLAPTGPVADKGDMPKQSSPFLVPRVGTMLPEMGTDSALAEAPGHTIVNGPGEEVPEEALREYTAERAKHRLDEELGEMVAKAQRTNGLVNPYFTKLQADLAQGFVGVDVKLSKRGTVQALKEEVVDTYTGPAERFAKTGSPLASDDQATQFSESSFGRTLERGGPASSDVNSQRMLQAGLQSMAFTAVLKDSASRPRLKTVLMLRQDGDGALAEAKVLEHSGDLEFDEFVLHLSRKVVRDQGDTSEKGGAPSALGWSSVWQFTWEPPEVKVKLLRVLKSAAPPLQLQ